MSPGSATMYGNVVYGQPSCQARIGWPCPGRLLIAVCGLYSSPWGGHRSLGTSFRRQDFPWTAESKEMEDDRQVVHDEVIDCKHFPRYWPFVQGIHRSPVNSPHKGQWRWDLMFSLICAWINGWVNNHEPGDLRCHRAHYDITVMHRQ